MLFICLLIGLLLAGIHYFIDRWRWHGGRCLCDRAWEKVWCDDMGFRHYQCDLCGNVISVFWPVDKKGK